MEKFRYHCNVGNTIQIGHCGMCIPVRRKSLTCPNKQVIQLKKLHLSRSYFVGEMKGKCSGGL